MLDGPLVVLPRVCASEARPGPRGVKEELGRSLGAGLGPVELLLAPACGTVPSPVGGCGARGACDGLRRPLTGPIEERRRFCDREDLRRPCAAFSKLERV